MARTLANVICDFCFPKCVQSDCGSENVNELMALVMKHSGIDHRLTVPYNPRANGVAEKYVGLTKNAIKKRLQGKNDSWDVYLGATQLALNCKYSRLQNSRPFSVMFARSPNHFENYSDVEIATEELSIPI
jgi:hypothetical protein